MSFEAIPTATFDYWNGELNDEAQIVNHSLPFSYYVASGVTHDKSSSEKINVNLDEKCEFVFARKSTLKGKRVNKGDRCLNQKEKDSSYCKMHSYAESRRRKRREENSRPGNEDDDNDEKDDGSKSAPENHIQKLEKRIDGLQDTINAMQRQISQLQEITLALNKPKT